MNWPPFFATSLEPGDGGALQFRAPDGRFCEIQPRAGVFVCFDGLCEHQVPRCKLRHGGFPLR